MTTTSTGPLRTGKGDTRRCPLLEEHGHDAAHVDDLGLSDHGCNPGGRGIVVRCSESQGAAVHRLLISLVLLTAACSSTGLFDDPVFLSVGDARTSSGACPDGSTCLEVPLTALVEAAGRTGQCEIYATPGDPATMEPLAAASVEVPAADDTDDFEIPFVWHVTIPAVVDADSLNPVCAPMIEG